MKPQYQALLAVAFSLSACSVDHWEGGGRRQELPEDERTPEATGGTSTEAGGASVAGLEPDESSGASGDGGAAGGGGLAESAAPPASWARPARQEFPGFHKSNQRSPARACTVRVMSDVPLPLSQRGHGPPGGVADGAGEPQSQGS